MKSIGLLRILLGLYILSISFTDLLHLPQLGSKLQIPELLFLPLAAVFIIALPSNFQKFQINILDKIILGFGLCALLSAAFSHHLSSWLDTAGIFYLIILYLIAKTMLTHLDQPIAFMVKTFTASGMIAASIGIFGWLLNAAGIQTRLVSSPDCYFLYTDNLMQASGFMNTPNLLHNLISICLIFFLHGFLNTDKKHLTQWLTLFILIAGLIVTFSKSSIFLVIALLWLFQSRFHFSKWISGVMRTASVFLFITTIVMSHVLVTTDAHKIERISGDQSCYSKEVLTTFEVLSVYPTNYLINKISALRAFLSSPLFGTGPGQYNSFIVDLKAKHLYPEYFVSFDPHCTYTGTLAELGSIAFIVLMLIGFLFWKKLSLKNKSIDYWSVTLKTCFIYFILEAINMDILNFRHLWIFLAIAASHIILQKK